MLAELEKLNLQPAAEADRRTLARRLSLDLTGLPPAAAGVEAFRQRRHPLLRRLPRSTSIGCPQRSVHWGRAHRGRYWLDAARYADTHGIHFDNFREMWSYRDWVIGAFNKNMPFDQFTLEQLGGDLAAQSHRGEQQVASGFNRCNITSNEGGLIAEEYLVLYTRDRTETTAATGVAGDDSGLCRLSRSQIRSADASAEFYQMAAFFNNTTQGAMDGNTSPTRRRSSRWHACRRSAAKPGGSQQGEVEQTRSQAETRKQAAQAAFLKAGTAQSRPSRNRSLP